MAFSYCQLVFDCDSCGTQIDVFPDMATENIPKLTEWVEWAFEQDSTHFLEPASKSAGKHLCSKCTSRFN